MASIILAIVALIAATRSNASPLSPKGHNCHQFTVGIALTDVPTVVLPFPPIQNQEQATYYANLITKRPIPGAPQAVPEYVNLTKNFTINGEWCAPSRPGPKTSTLQLLTHGLGFNRTYWDFYLPNSKDPQYSYVNSATAAGYSTLSWNRIGHAPSTLADPDTEIQATVERDLLIELTKLARAGKIPGLHAPKKIIHVGHSYGSLISIGLTAAAPEVSDGVVITGWSQNAQSAGYVVAASSFNIANLNNPKRFPKHLFPNGYLTWPSATANQYAFFAFPAFDPAVLAHAEATKHPWTLGEFGSQLQLPTASPNFKNPVFYLGGQHDVIACGFDCTDLYGPDSAAVRTYNGTDSLEVYIHPNVGHALNLHKNATAAYNIVNDWVDRHF